MDNTLFQFAFIPLSGARENTDWIVIDHDKNYRNVDVLDFPQEYINQVFTLYEKSYQKYTKKNNSQLISDPQGLLKYNRWILFYRESDPDKNMVCFSLFKTTEFGLKSSLSGTNGSKEGKQSIISFKIRSFNTFGGFGEISDRLEELILKEVPVVEFKTAKRILKGLGKKEVIETSNNHYKRKIGDLGIIEKIMVGLPIEK